jgi:hypothetical protein
MKVLAYLNDSTVKPGTQTGRLKAWAHDNAFTICWITAMNTVGWVVTVLQCH